MKKKLLSILLVLCMLMSVMPLSGIAVSAADGDVEYITPVYRRKNDTSSGVKEWKTETKVSGEYTLLTSDNMPDTLGTVGTETWYVVKGYITKTNTVAIYGNVNLILLNNSRLEVSSDNSYEPGVRVSGSMNSLTVYGQEASTGVLEATGGYYAAGIGADYYEYANNINILGGNIRAVGGYYADGIGSGTNGEASSNIKVCTDMIIKGGSSSIPTNRIPNSGLDIWDNFTGSRYVQIQRGYKVNVAKYAQGEIILDNGYTTYCAGDNVPVSTQAMDGFALTSLTITLASGESFDLGYGLFSMPRQDVTLTAQFNYVNDTLKNVKYIDEDGAERICPEAAIVTPLVEEFDDSVFDGWYVVAEDIYFNDTLKCVGDINLILLDGVTLSVYGRSGEAGITATGGNSFTVYGQKESSGKLNAYGGENGAGIGGDGKYYGQNITINGGTIYAEGGRYGAGIGGGKEMRGYDITINGGFVTAKGGGYAAGIGGGMEELGGYITVNGGKVTATGGEHAAGIGGGMSSYGTHIDINGGIVFAAGGDDDASAIGNGASCYDSSNININSDLFIQVGSENPPQEFIYSYGYDMAYDFSEKQFAKIQTGFEVVIGNCENGSVTTDYDRYIDGDTVNIYTYANKGYELDYLILDGEVFEGTSFTMPEKDVTLEAYFKLSNYSVNVADTANGTVTVSQESANYGDEITVKTYPDDGYHTDTITVTDAKGKPVELDGKKFTMPASDVTVTVTFKSDIETAENIPYIDENGEEQICPEATVVSEYVTFFDGSATNGWYVVMNGDSVTLNDTLYSAGNIKLILCDGGELTVTGRDYASAVKVVGENTLAIYGQSEGTGILNANGGIQGAGIGGAFHEASGEITINGGTVNANGGSDGAGIGGGYDAGDGASNITINAGTITAKGGSYGAGIGGGHMGDASDIVINGGTVNATGGYFGAGIGSGYHGEAKNITINGGVITATGTGYGAGIGSTNCDCENITITGGTVTAIGGEYASGIGHGIGSVTDGIAITGGTVTAIGGKYGDAIGIGYSGSATNITAAANLVVKADKNENPEAKIANDGSDIASALKNKRYAVITPGYTVSDNSENGSVKSDYSAYLAGETVVLTVSANEGYEFDKLTVTDANGNPITVENNAFTMPEGNVTVSATFTLSDVDFSFTAEADTLSVTVGNTREVKGYWIASGTRTTYREVKNNLVYGSTSPAHDRAFAVADGDYTCCVKYTDGGEEFYYATASNGLVKGKVALNGMTLVFTDLSATKHIRIAYGEYTKNSEIKAANGCITVTASKFTDGIYSIDFTKSGTYTVAITDIEGKVQFITVTLTGAADKVGIAANGNVITFTGVDETISHIRYAKGEYATASEVKKAQGCLTTQKKGTVDSKKLTSGIYTVAIHGTDGSVRIESVEIK